jgi:dipeptidyl aminopeptidase/acylaminoacyl peptidase
MKRCYFLERAATTVFLLAAVLTGRATPQAPARPFTVEQILSFPSPENLIASPTGSAIAWSFNERGVRNVYVAAGPGFEARRVTSYKNDDGQELTHLAFSKDGKSIVYVRGGDHGSGRPGDDGPPDPAQLPVQPKIQIWSVPVAGGEAKVLADGDDFAIAPDSGRVAFAKDKRIWTVPIDGSKPAQMLFFARDSSESPAWSPDGRTLAFVSNRTDHSFIGLFTPDQPIRFIAPSTSRDTQPAWSPDGKKIAFLRQPGVGGAPRPPLAQFDSPWTLLIAEVQSGALSTAITSGDNPVDPIQQNPGGIGFRWAADDTLVLSLYRDGWPHLYCIEHPGAGGKPVLRTPGSFMVEQWTLTPDLRTVIYSANTGADRSDVGRRHLYRVPVSSASAPAPVSLTSGTTIDWGPVVSSDGQNVAFLTSGPQLAPLPAVVSIAGGNPRMIGANLVPADFPSAQLVTPELVSFRASDGVEAHGQLFKPNGGAARKPAVVYIHGGGPRQMLLGWHTRWEYANDYGANQYLASQGFIVLSVDYRLSVGYGQAFQFPNNTGARGATEYRDVLAAGRYLQSRTDVDSRRIGIWGASLGGYLTALGLGRNSDVFAAGVDVHGVHDRVPTLTTDQLTHAMIGDGITEADLKQAVKVAYDSSPISTVATWKSPVLFIHGDDDRIVNFRQTIDMRNRLLAKGVKVEELVLPDDEHDSLLWQHWKTSISAMAEFFVRKLKTPSP